MISMCLGSVLNVDMHVLVSISDWYPFNIWTFVQIWVIAVWYMFNVWFFMLFFISRFSCTICVLLCALCVGKGNHIHSNVSVVFCGWISAGRYTWHAFYMSNAFRQFCIMVVLYLTLMQATSWHSSYLTTATEVGIQFTLEMESVHDMGNMPYNNHCQKTHHLMER